MLLHVTREQSQSSGFRGKKFEYKVHCKVEFAEPEVKLLEKYDGWGEKIRVLSVDGNKIVKGPMIVSPQSLAGNGQSWTAEHVYTDLSNIPQILQNALAETFNVLLVRENWGEGSSSTETIEIAAE